MPILPGVFLVTNIVLSSVLWAVAVPGIEHGSQDTCKPPAIDNTGQVSVDCPSMDPRAQTYLATQLTLLFHNLTGQADNSRTTRGVNGILRQQAADWEKRYRELSARLADDPRDGDKSKEASALIRQGQVDKAEAILEELAAGQGADAASAAETQYNLGDLAMLRFDPASALPHYNKAFQLKPDNPWYADVYGRVAYQARDYAGAERGWATALQRQRELAVEDPAGRSDVAAMLNNLGVLYGITGRKADAEKVYAEALSIQRELAEHDPATYQPDVAATLSNLGILYRDAGRTADAEKRRTLRRSRSSASWRSAIPQSTGLASPRH